MYPPPGLLGPRAIAAWALRTKTRNVEVEGLANVPPSGPVVLLARHYHHLLDGAALIERVPRPLHIVVGLDWAADTTQRRWMERACRWAHYPVILRAGTTGERAGYRRSEALAYLRRGVRDAAALLAAGRVILIFPEGYPLVDPSRPAAGPTRDADGFAPFAAGYRTITAVAGRAGAAGIALVPVGFAYDFDRGRWNIRARIGAALPPRSDVSAIEHAVRTLSR